MIGCVVDRRVGRAGGCSFRVALLGSVSLVALSCLGDAQAGQLPSTAFQTYNAANASSILPGPFSLFTVPVDQLQPTQLNEGFTEVDKKATGFDILVPAQLQSNLLGDIEPVVIGPGGVLYLTDGHHTFTALENSSFGPADPTVYVNVIANFSNLTTTQFFAQMQADDLLLPLNDGVPQVVNLATGAPIPTSLQGLTSDPYRGLEYSILKNKNSKLFTTTSNISGVVGSAKPGLDKITGLYGDFIWADAYRKANGGLGLPYLSPGDIQLATQWNLNPNSVTSEPNVGTVTVAQLPGFILNKNISIGTTISNATLSTGTLDGDGGFTGITSFNLGTPGNPIIVGTPQSGFVMQLGNDLGFSATLSGTNTYTGGTTIIAGTLIVNSDAALGGASPTSYTINPNSILASVQAANGIVFNSLTEGNGTLQTSTSFSTNRPIAVDGEVANLAPASGTTLTLTGQIVSLGTNGVALSNATGTGDLTINGLSNSTSKVVLAPSIGGNPLFFGNWVISSGTLEVSSDAALGNTTGPSYEIGQIELNGGTFQAGASFSSVRSLFLGGGSSYDTNGFVTSFSGTLNDIQRTLTIENSNAGTQGSVTFGNFTVGSTAILAVDAGTGTTGGAGTIVTFTNGISRNGNTDPGAPPNATLFIDPSTGSTLGSSAANGVEVFSGGASAALTNGIAPVWIITDSGGGASTNPYNFVTYSSGNGYTAATAAYTGTFGASNVVEVSSSQTISSSQAFALNVQNGKTLTINGGNTLTVGDGTDPAGLILEGTTSITGGTLAFQASEAVIEVKGTNTISSAVTGTGGLTLSGSGTLVLSGTAGGLSGPIVVNSGTLQLNTANYFPTSGGGTSIWLSNVKTNPSPAILTVDASNVISALNSDGTNSTVNIATGITLTIGDNNNLSSTLSSTIAGTGTGSLVKAGTGLLDISGSGGVSFGAGGSVSVNAGALRIGNGLFSASATTPITVAAGAELQYSGNGGSMFNDPIQGSGVFHLLGGTVQLTGTSNTYSGGTVIETSATLDVTTANLPSGGNISNAGGTLVFDQTATGTFTGVMSDGQQSGGPNNPNDLACTLVSCSGPTLSGTLIKDDSTNGDGGNVTLSAVQAYSGLTYIEAGTLTLGAVDTIKSSAGVILGRVGGSVCNPSPCSGVTATLALGANNTIGGLADNPANTTQVLLNGHTLTLTPIMGSTWSYGGSIVDGSTAGGSLVHNGPGTTILTGTSTYTGTTTINAGMLEVNGAITSSSSVSVNSGGTLSGDGTVDPATVTIFSGGTFAPGLPGTPGTSMTIAGTLAFQSGALYLVQINSSASTFANVTGTAALGGNVLAMLTPGTNPLKQYTILQSAGLNGTTFAAAGTTNPNFDASLGYTNTNVLLNISAALGSGVGLNGNQQNVANAINNFFNGGGTLPPNFVNVFGLTGGNLANALSQLSGELGTTSTTAGLDATSQFLNQLLDPFAGDRSGFAGTQGQAMGFAPERSDVPDVLLAYAKNITKAPAAALYDDRWNVWGGAFGGQSIVSGDPTAGSNGADVRNFGVSTGFDRRLSPNSVVGFAVAGSGTNFSLSNGLGSGRGDIFQAAAYGSTRIDQFYVSAAGAFSADDLSTSRPVSIGGATDQLSAKFGAYGLGARLETGRRFPVAPGFGVTPFAALQGQSMWTPSYAESSALGSAFALSYGAQTTSRLRSELGAGIDGRYFVASGQLLTFYARAAWAYEYLRSTSVNAAFLALPAAGFSVQGAQPPANAAVLTLGSVVAFTNSVSFRTKLEGEFGRGSTTYAASGTLQYTW
jgi:autotransporter-associated beta strand protein